jgi:hypothetical protein
MTQLTLGVAATALVVVPRPQWSASLPRGFSLPDGTALWLPAIK